MVWWRLLGTSRKLRYSSLYSSSSSTFTLLWVREKITFIYVKYFLDDDNSSSSVEYKANSFDCRAAEPGATHNNIYICTNNCKINILSMTWCWSVDSTHNNAMTPPVNVKFWGQKCVVVT